MLCRAGLRAHNCRPWYPAWLTIDFAAEGRAHYARIGVAVPGFDERLRCYALQIGLCDIAYNAHRKRPDRWAENAARLVEFARA